MKVGSSYSRVSTSLSPLFQKMDILKLNLRLGLFDGWNLYAEPLRNIKANSCQLTQRKLKGKNSLLKRRCILYATPEDESYRDLEPDNSSRKVQILLLKMIFLKILHIIILKELGKNRIYFILWTNNKK